MAPKRITGERGHIIRDYNSNPGWRLEIVKYDSTVTWKIPLVFPLFQRGMPSSSDCCY
jgi:hypothetical protein